MTHAIMTLDDTELDAVHGGGGFLSHNFSGNTNWQAAVNVNIQGLGSVGSVTQIAQNSANFGIVF
ncbi:MAG: hypothetical protein WAO16_25515 [Pseudolabrys sp.]|jgi:hypothetical protein